MAINALECQKAYNCSLVSDLFFISNPIVNTLNYSPTFLRIALLLLMLQVTDAKAQIGPTKLFNLKKQIALEGYDVVSYFKQDVPVQGKENIQYDYHGAIYLFESTENLKEFSLAPESYIPMYGGWCAYAMGKNGSKVKVDPLTFKILDKQLYLFYNFRSNNTLSDWEDDEVSLKNSADAYWADLINKRR